MLVEFFQARGGIDHFADAVRGVNALWALRLQTADPATGRIAADGAATRHASYRLVNSAGLIANGGGTAVNVGAEQYPGYRDAILDTTDGMPFAEVRAAAIAATRD